VVVRTTQAHRREWVQALEHLVESTPEPPFPGWGEFFEDGTVSNRFLWAEWWPEEGDLGRALGSDRLRALLAAARLLGSVEAVRKLKLLDVAGSEPGAGHDGEASMAAQPIKHNTRR